MHPIVTFWASGIPATKGSWLVTSSRALRPDNKREAPWATTVGWAAKIARVRLATWPVKLRIDFFFPRPKHPKYPFPARNDVDKLARSCLDALTKIGYADDHQVVELAVTKQWAGADGPGARFVIEESVLPGLGVV